MTPDTDWRPTASLEVLRLRARFLAQIREFFAERQVLEVETPLLSCSGVTDPHIESMCASYQGPAASQGMQVYLQTSPEFPMKRLLAAGSGSIYQIARVFRQGELGRLHNPEFTLLEWYRPGFGYQDLMREVSELLHHLLAERLPLGAVEYLSYSEAFQKFTGIDPFDVDMHALCHAAQQLGIHVSHELQLRNDKDAWLDLLLSHVIEPQLGRGRLCFLYDYPPSQAALARLRPGRPVAERFELYLQGTELANGFHELGDSAEQRRRFERDLELRRQRGQAAIALDEHLLAALASGLPECSGVALGLDRLLMLAAGKTRLEEVLAFPFGRA